MKATRCGWRRVLTAIGGVAAFMAVAPGARAESFRVTKLRRLGRRWRLMGRWWARLRFRARTTLADIFTRPMWCSARGWNIAWCCGCRRWIRVAADYADGWAVRLDRDYRETSWEILFAAGGPLRIEIGGGGGGTGNGRGPGGPDPSAWHRIVGGRRDGGDGERGDRFGSGGSGNLCGWEVCGPDAIDNSAPAGTHHVEVKARGRMHWERDLTAVEEGQVSLKAVLEMP